MSASSLLTNDTIRLDNWTSNLQNQTVAFKDFAAPGNSSLYLSEISILKNMRRHLGNLTSILTSQTKLLESSSLNRTEIGANREPHIARPGEYHSGPG